VLAHSAVVRISGTVLLLLLALVFSSSSQAPGADPGAGFHVSQALILLGLYGPAVPAICGAYLGGAEWDWRTRPWRLVVDGRRTLWSARVLLLASAALAGVVAGGVLGGFFDLVSGYAEYAAADLALRMLYLWGVALFWGLVGFLLATLLRSFTGGAVIPVVWVLLEPLADFYLPPGIAQFLPVWNIKIVLHSLFPNRDGALAVILPASGDSAVSALLSMVYLAGALALSYAAASRRDH
jgi:hypothetical protein